MLVEAPTPASSTLRACVIVSLVVESFMLLLAGRKLRVRRLLYEEHGENVAGFASGREQQSRRGCR